VRKPAVGSRGKDDVVEYKNVGKSGLKVSAVGVGCMSFGHQGAGTAHSRWVIDEDDAGRIVKTALDGGVNFFDTANVYSAGTSEEITGRLLNKLARREDVVVATKLFQPMRKSPTAGGLSRKEIMFEVDQSLRRLGLDYIDLYQIHRWDDETPAEETMAALHDVIRAGKVRYIGASSMPAWQFAKAQYTADQGGWTRFISMQNHYNLLYRLEELEMIPQCLDQGVGVVPFSPLARGTLARAADEKTQRSEADGSASRYRDSQRTVELVGEIAAERGLPRAVIALAWLMAQPAVTAPIVGSTKVTHIEDAIAAVDVALSRAELDMLSGGSPPPDLGYRLGSEVLRLRRA
jgi:aryl-alcohol dehydrogenase-like predicted oxidoreductase